MLSSSKIAALRLSLQPLSCFANTPSFGPAPTPAPYTPGLPLSAGLAYQQHRHELQAQQDLPKQPPRRLRLSPVPDSLLCSPTPTRAAFLLTPTRFAPPPMSSPSEPEAATPFLSPSTDPRSPILSTCLCEGCENIVSSERNTCPNCREIFLSLLSHQRNAMAHVQLQSPNQPSPVDTTGEIHHAWTVEYGNNIAKEELAHEQSAHLAENGQQNNGPKVTAQPLSVAHPRPHPIRTSQCDLQTSKMARRSDTEAEDRSSPDALYFGKRSRRTYAGHTVRRPVAAEPFFPNLKTSSRIQKVQDGDLTP